MRLQAFAVLSVAAIGAGWPGFGESPVLSSPQRADYRGSAESRTKPLLYVSTSRGSATTVLIFKQAGNGQQPIGQIDQEVDDAFGLFVDEQRNLYVANALNGTVTVYPPGATSPSEVLQDAGAPNDVVVAPDGTVFVANNQTIFYPKGGGSVLEYQSGQTEPTKTIVTFSGTSGPRAVALDKAGDLYVAYNHDYGASWKPHGRILEFAPGASSGRDLGIRVGAVGGLAIDKRNDLVLVQNGNPFYFPPSIDIFAPGNKKPSKKIPFPYGYRGYDVALNSSNTEMWVTWSAYPSGGVFGLTYPRGQLVDTITSGLGLFVLGVATSPDGAP